MVKRSGAHSTHLISPEEVDFLTEKCRPTAERWATTPPQEIWAASPAGKVRRACASSKEISCAKGRTHPSMPYHRDMAQA